jgi:hypothetical protein
LYFDALKTNSKCLANEERTTKLEKDIQIHSEQCSNLKAFMQTSNICNTNENLRDIQNSEKEQCNEPDMNLKFDTLESKPKKIN